MKNIILTGSSSGFGMVTARTLAQAGHHVIATMRNIDTKNKEAAQSLLDWADTHQAKLSIIELDVTSDASVQIAMDQILQQTNGQIDVLINNAGSAYIGLNETLSPAQTDAMFQVNVIGVDRMIKAALPYMHKRNQGLILTISSVASRQPIPIMGIYGATKAAVDALCVSYYYELLSTGVDIALVQPGAYPSTDIVTKQPVPANPQSEQYYGSDMQNFKASVMRTFTPGPLDPDPGEVANVILDLVDSRKGKRALWTIVRGGYKEQAIRHINQSIRELVDTILQSSGMPKELFTS